MELDKNIAGRSPSVSLGPLEREVFLVIRESQEACVQDVRNHLSRPLAYTTVMTTLDRLYKKSLLERRKSGRGFLYKISQYLPASSLHSVEGLSFSTAGIASYLVNAVSLYDETMLDELEQKIAERRRQFAQREER